MAGTAARRPDSTVVSERFQNSPAAAGGPIAERFLNPRSVALFGASSDESKLRGRITRILAEGAYDGPIHFINPSHREVHGCACVADIAGVTEPVDLAIVVLPAANVVPALEACEAANVATVLIMTSGFAEEGGAQADLQERIAEIGRRSGMRICGPNAEGFHNERNGLSATFSPAVELDPADLYTATTRRAGIIAQSGGMGFSLYHRGRTMGLAFSAVVTTGNECDMTVADFLEYFVEDEGTDIIMMFLETVRDGPRFAAALERAGRAGKPVIALKVGRSAAAARATISHTGAMAGWDAAYDAAFRTHGVTVVDQPATALAAAVGFAANPLLAGRRAAVMTVSGGAGALCADTLSRIGFELPETRPELQEAIGKIIPTYGATANPIDVTGQATRTGAPMRVLEMLAEEDEVDLVVFACTMASAHRTPVDVDRLKALLEARRKPVLFFSYTLASEFGRRGLAEAGMVAFDRLDDVATVATALRDRAAYELRLQARGVAEAGPVRLEVEDGVVAEHRAKDLLRSAGFPVADFVLARDAADLERVPASMFPVAAKVQSADIPHKTEAGGIRLGIADAQELETAHGDLLQTVRRSVPDARIDGVLIEPMTAPGVEVVVGVVRDATFGPVVTVGAGGIATELYRDVARRLAPVTESEAVEMLEELACFPLLQGFRGAAKADVAALAELVARLSRLEVAESGRQREIEINPVIVHDQGRGCTVADALMLIGADEVGGPSRGTGHI